MGIDDHPLDLEYLTNEILRRVPGSLRIVFEHFDVVHPERGLLLLVPPADATYFEQDHPRIPGSMQTGLREEDSVSVLPHSVSAQEVETSIASSGATTVVGFIDRSPEGAGELIVSCIQALPGSGSVDIVVPQNFLSSHDAQTARRALLQSGTVTDLFDGGAYWYIGWGGPQMDLGGPTQVVRVPPPDHWSEFSEALKTWTPLWRWGDLTKLPAERPWTWEEIETDYVSLIKRLEWELGQIDTSTPTATAAYVRLGYIEICLRYIVHLRLGEDVGDMLRLLPEARRTAVQQRMEKSRHPAHSFLNLIDFEKLIRKGWPNFQAVFAPPEEHSKERAVPSLSAANEIRNRAMHPTRMLSQRITDEDLSTLDALVGKLRSAVVRAEELLEATQDSQS